MCVGRVGESGGGGRGEERRTRREKNETRRDEIATKRSEKVRREEKAHLLGSLEGELSGDGDGDEVL